MSKSGIENALTNMIKQMNRISSIGVKVPKQNEEERATSSKSISAENAARLEQFFGPDNGKIMTGLPIDFAQSFKIKNVDNATASNAPSSVPYYLQPQSVAFKQPNKAPGAPRLKKLALAPSPKPKMERRRIYDKEREYVKEEDIMAETYPKTRKLYSSILENKIGEVKYLLDSQTEDDEYTPHELIGALALTIGSETLTDDQKSRLVKMLIEKGANPDGYIVYKDDEKNPIMLYEAIRKNLTETVKALVEGGVSFSNKEGKDLVMRYSLDKKRYDIVEYLLTKVPLTRTLANNLMDYAEKPETRQFVINLFKKTQMPSSMFREVIQSQFEDDFNVANLNLRYGWEKDFYNVMKPLLIMGIENGATAENVLDSIDDPRLAFLLKTKPTRARL